MADSIPDAWTKALAALSPDPFAGPGDPEDLDTVTEKLRRHAEAEEAASRWVLGGGEAS